MNKIQRVSRYFRILFQLIFISMPILQAIGWSYAPGELQFGIGAIDMIPDMYRKHILVSSFGLDTKLLAFLVSMMTVSVDLFVLYFLVRLFKLYEQGEIFSIDNVGYLRKIGYALLVGQLLINPVYEFILGVVLTWHNPPGHGIASITIGTTNIGIVLMAFLVILVSWIMAEGCKLREEQQLTV
jgi:hypothetical protein